MPLLSGAQARHANAPALKGGLASDLGPPEGCEGGRAAAGTGPAPWAVPPEGKAEPSRVGGLLPGVNDGAFTFSLNSRANGFSFDFGVPDGCVAPLSPPMTLPEHHTSHNHRLAETAHAHLGSA